MHIATITAFDDELQKIAAGLSGVQMLAQEAKGVKRGWSGARTNKSVNRLLNRDARPAFREAQAAKGPSKFHAPMPNEGATSVGRRPAGGGKPPPPVADASHSGTTRTFVRPQQQAMPGRRAMPWKHMLGGAAIGGAAFGAGAMTNQPQAT